MKIKIFIPILIALVVISCKEAIKENKKQEAISSHKVNSSNDKIEVLNLGTFHFGYTSDATKVEFNEEGDKEQQEIRNLNKLLSEFKPTIVCVEIQPEYEENLNKSYQKYLENHDELDASWGEISLVAFEVARMNNVEKIYAIDHQMGYNYSIGEEVTNSIDSLTYREYVNNPFKDFPELDVKDEDMNLLEKIRRMNNYDYQDFLLNINADILTYVGTEGNFEGADEAAKFYQRNLRMFSNINRIPMNKDDRVFILSGGAHASFFREFMSRSPKYNLVDVLDYLGE